MFEKVRRFHYVWDDSENRSRNPGENLLRVMKSTCMILRSRSFFRIKFPKGWIVRIRRCVICIEVGFRISIGWGDSLCIKVHLYSSLMDVWDHKFCKKYFSDTFALDIKTAAVKHLVMALKVLTVHCLASKNKPPSLMIIFKRSFVISTSQLLQPCWSKNTKFKSS